MDTEKLRELRKERGLSQEKLAEIIGVGKSAISNYETGKREPKKEHMRMLVDYFGVSLDFLNGYVPKDLEQFNELLKERLVIKLDDTFKKKGIFADGAMIDDIVEDIMSSISSGIIRNA